MNQSKSEVKELIIYNVIYHNIDDIPLITKYNYIISNVNYIEKNKQIEILQYISSHCNID